MILVLCLLMLAGSSTNTFASKIAIENDQFSKSDIIPYMNYISNSFCSLLKKSTGQIELNCWVDGYQGVTTKIHLTLLLEEHVNGTWQTIKRYEQTSNSHKASMVRTTGVTSGKSYRITALIQAYSGTRSEIQIIRSKEIKL